MCVSIGRYWYLFKRLTAVSAGRFFRFEHIVTYSSFKAHSKQRAILTLVFFFFYNGRGLFFPGSGTKQTQPRTQGCKDQVSFFGRPLPILNIAKHRPVSSLVRCQFCLRRESQGFLPPTVGQSPGRSV